MPISVNTNVGALAAMAASTQTNKALETAMTRLSTGKRINTAGDDAAGIAITARLTSEVKGLGIAIKNALDGQSLIDTTEGAQAEVTNILQRMRELAVKAANDTNSPSDRKNIDSEVQQLVIEVDRISSTTTWAGVKILHGADALDETPKALSFQVGFMDEDSQKINVSVKSTSSKSLDILPTDTTVALVSTAPSTGASNVVPFIDASGGISLTPFLPATLNTTAGITATRTGDSIITFGGSTVTASETVNITLAGKVIPVALTSTDDPALVATAFKTAIEAALPGVTATASGTPANILTLTKASTTTGSMEITINGQPVKVTVGSAESNATILGNLSEAIRTAKVPGVYMTESATTAGTYSIAKHAFGAKTAEEALSALTRIDNAIEAVNDQRSALGAISNRLTYTVNNLTNIVTNLDISRGRIEDADFALESANMARFQILQQASTAMLAQANAAKQDVLSLIK
jgi:flagellin